MPRKLTDADAENFIRRYQAGKSLRELSTIFGVSNRSLSDYLKRAGIQARPKHVGIMAWAADEDPQLKSARISASMTKRWAAANAEQRQNMLNPAHAATRGVPVPTERKRKAALTREQRSGTDSRYEDQVSQWLVELGVEFRNQVAIGEYCADITLGNTAVEITTGWARKKNWSPRFTRFFDSDWNLYVIWHDTRYAMRRTVAEDLVAWHQSIESTPPSGGQHRVIWRSRQILSCGRNNAEYVAGVMRSSTPHGYWPIHHSPGN